MKTGEIKEVVANQDGGCCTPTPQLKETEVNSCCGDASMTDETLQTGGGCCG